MKKTILFMLLVLLACLMVIPASAATQDHPHNGDHCVCGGSAVDVHDHQCADITWKPMPTGTTNFTDLPAGNYYLTQDITVTGVTHFPKNHQLAICLNGYNINTTANGVFGYVKLDAVLSICDCSGSQDENGIWTWGGTITGNQTGGTRKYGGIINVNANGALYIYGGNYVGAEGTTEGSVFVVCNDSYKEAGGTSDKDTSLHSSLNIYNGHITGGTSTKDAGVINSWHNPTLNIYGGTIVGGTAPTRGNLDITSTTKTTIENCTITGGNPGVILIMDSKGYVSMSNTLSDALTKVKSTQYIRLTGDINEAVTIPDGVLIDLAGNDLSGVTVSTGACFMDSTTDSYYGGIAGSLTPAGGTIADTYKTTAAQAGAIKRYLVLKENGSYSFHRFYMALTKLTLKPGTAGMGYKATFVGSDYVKERLSATTAYGYRMWLNEDNKIVRGYPASRFGGEQELTLRIDNFLDSSLTTEENNQRAKIPVYACAYIQLADGTLVETDAVSYTFRDMLEKANSSYSSYTATQQNALKNLSSKFSRSMISWDISSIHHPAGSIWKSVNNTTFNTLLKNNSNSLPSGSYVLTGNIDIGTRTIKIAAGRTVNICLNGYTLTSSNRIFSNYGSLNICDCHAEDREGTLKGSFTFDNDSTDAGEYTPIMYCFANSVTNLYGGNLKAVNPVSYAGLLAIAHDNSDKTLPSAVFNMYGGTLHGNTVTAKSTTNKTANGGAVCIWHGATFNLYDGTVIGGTATHGGAFMIAAGCTMNMYGGTITGGSATNGALASGVAPGGKGGNIYNSGTLNIYGGTISDGSAQEGKGGNIFSPGDLNIYGGTITGGSATVLLDENGEETYCTGVGGGICMSSGNINISGNPVIDGNDNYNLYLSYISNVDIKDLTGDAKIGIASDIDCVISQDTSTASKIYSEQEGCNLYTANGRVQLSASQPAAFDQNVSEFSVGYAIESIHPTEYGLKMSPWGNPEGRTTKAPNEKGGSDNGYTGIELCATIVAITDKANNTVLMITLDLQSIGDSFAESFSRYISDATGVPVDHIYISCTHTHNCPSLTTELPGNTRYTSMVAERLITGAIKAMADRAPATMKVGSFETYRMNFTRNYYYYLNNDTTTEPIYYGDQFGQAPSNGETIYRVREGDHTMHLLVFERSSDKQPVLVSNWRAHPHRSGGMFMYTSDSDVIGATRNYFQENTDYLFAYFQGAAGNMNTTSRLNSSKYPVEQRQFGNKTNDGLEAYIQNYGNELGRQIVENGFPNLKKTETGLIQTDSIIYAAPVNHDDEIYYKNAMRLWTYHKENPTLMDSLTEQLAEANKILEEDLVLEDGTVLKAGTRKYEGVFSVYHAQQIISRHNLSETKNISLNTFSIGNQVGFCTSAGEIWDRVSEEIEENSPFDTTFFIGYCDGGVGYIPYGVAGNYESYEYYSCVFKQDEVILQIMDYLLGFLDKQHENAAN